MIALTCALSTAAVLSLWFPQTRAIGIGCVTVLCFLYPIPVVSLLIGIGILYYVKRKP